MTSVFYNKNQIEIFDHMKSYLYKKETDCSLFSEDGYEFPIHKVSYIVL